MKIVLERLRDGGLVCVLEGMRRDREAAFHGGRAGSATTTWKRVWENGDRGEGEQDT
jgi:hypothetical protein